MSDRLESVFQGRGGSVSTAVRSGCYNFLGNLGFGSSKKGENTTVNEFLTQVASPLLGDGHGILELPSQRTVCKSCPFCNKCIKMYQKWKTKV